MTSSGDEPECSLERASQTTAVLQASLKEKLKLDRRLGEIAALERRAHQGQPLHFLQKEKIARKPLLEANLARLRAELQTVALPSVLPPTGLYVARLAPALVLSALEELRPRLSQESASFTKGSTVFEVGLAFYNGEHGGSQQAATSLAELPQLQLLLAAATEALGDSLPDADTARDHRLNVICRRYLPGQSLGLHSDAIDRFEEDVYGCVLENTSGETLQFHHSLDGSVYVLQEPPGTCFRQRGEARFDWLHGIDPLTKGERFSVTWRWFRADFHDAFGMSPLMDIPVPLESTGGYEGLKKLLLEGIN